MKVIFLDVDGFLFQQMLSVYISISVSSSIYWIEYHLKTI